MNIQYVKHSNLVETLTKQASHSLEFIILVTGSLDTGNQVELFQILNESARALRDGGLLFVQGIPRVLPASGIFLEKHLHFKYWFAIESTLLNTTPLPSVHAAVMLFTKGNGRFNIKQARLPHRYCKACGRTLKDWGGKAHLMNPAGYVISDVIKDLPPTNNYSQLSQAMFDLLIELLDFPLENKVQQDQLMDMPQPEVSGLVGPLEGLAWKRKPATDGLAAAPVQYVLPTFPAPTAGRRSPQPQLAAPLSIDASKLFNVVHQGDAVDILRQYPDESVDLVFADPPYNLDKNYTAYDDEQADLNYVAWCNTWLAEYARILKPTGSLFVLNLPHWALYHADFLNKHLYFQNWIVWDALSEPLGKIMPAHYALLFYTKQVAGFTFNYEAVSPIDARDYCLRAACIQKRKKIEDDDKTPLTDLWWDIHRIKHRRDRDYHPCQLPELLMERIIRLATNPDDVVLDAFGGTGTTPLAALRLGRRYVAMDLDPNYIKIMQDKIAQVESLGKVQRPSVKQAARAVTKKALQLELRRLASDLGQLPTPEDVKEKSQYNLGLFLETFPTWGKALKAAKLETL